MVRFRFVTSIEFSEFLRAYPRPLSVKPSLGRRATFRSWSDETRGVWPENVVAKAFQHRWTAIYEALEIDLMIGHKGNESGGSLSPI